MSRTRHEGRRSILTRRNGQNPFAKLRNNPLHPANTESVQAFPGWRALAALEKRFFRLLQPQKTRGVRMKKRVVLVDHHTATRQMLACIVRRESGYEVAGEAGSGLDALALCRRDSPDLVILELALPELCGVELMHRLRVISPAMRLLVFSAASEREQVAGALRCRPHGFVSKKDPLGTLYEAIRVVSKGGLYFTPFATSAFQETLGVLRPALTDREREILQMIAESGSSKEIAARLGVAVKTVENHRAHIMEKLHLHDVAGLTRYAMRHGLVQ